MKKYDNIFLAFEMIDWVVESNQPMVMLFLDFGNAYDKAKWGFLAGLMAVLGFDNQ
jgi:hypothetical protein